MRSPRLAGAALGLVAVLTSVGGCGQAGGGDEHSSRTGSSHGSTPTGEPSPSAPARAHSDAPVATLHLLVRNINIRKVGQDCSGAGAYLFIHHSARFRIEDEGGDVVATGQIPVGTAAQAFDDDLGVSRVPTFCEFTMPVRLDVRDGYRLRVRGHEPIGLHAAGHRHPRALVAVVP